VLCCACAILRLAIISACLVCPFHRVASTFVVNKRSLLYLFIYLFIYKFYKRFNNATSEYTATLCNVKHRELKHKELVQI